jgi:two-component system chemotaxis response regulator CheB
MTGMGNDGSKSLRALKRAGITIVAQDEASSVVWGMPGSAVATGCVDRIASLMDLPKILEEIITLYTTHSGK